MISYFCSGELLLWDLSKEGKEQCQTFGLGHSRIVFNITCDVAGTRIMTVSMDRQVKKIDFEDISISIHVHVALFFNNLVGAKNTICQ